MYAACPVEKVRAELRLCTFFSIHFNRHFLAGLRDCTEAQFVSNLRLKAEDIHSRFGHNEISSRLSALADEISSAGVFHIVEREEVSRVAVSSTTATNSTSDEKEGRI